MTMKTARRMIKTRMAERRHHRLILRLWMALRWTRAIIRPISSISVGLEYYINSIKRSKVDVEGLAHHARDFKLIVM